MDVRSQFSMISASMDMMKNAHCLDKIAYHNKIKRGHDISNGYVTVEPRLIYAS